MSKGGTSSVEIPAWLENASIENINRARDVQKIGYVPYYGPDVAAMTPMQEQAMRATGMGAQAFGLAGADFDPLAGMPTAQTFDGGVRGYSSAPIYEQAVAELRERRPGQAQAIEGMFIDPLTGQYTGRNYAPTVEQILNTNYAQAGDTGAVMSALQTASDGGYFGVNQEYNPYTMQAATTDITGDGVIDYRDASFGEAGRRDIGTAERLVDFLNPFGLVGKALDYGEGLVDGFTPAFEHGLLAQSTGAMEPTEAQRIMEEAAARYEARQSAPQIPTSVLQDPEIAIAQAYDNAYNNTYDNLTYSDPDEEALMSQYIPQQDVQIGTIEPQNIIETVPGTDYEYDSSGRVGFTSGW